MIGALFKARPLTLHTSGYWFAAFSAATAMAFWPSYFGLLPARLDMLTHAHAALMTIWLGMLIAQPFLIKRGRRPLHRMIGRASYLLVPLIVIVWILLTHLRASGVPAADFEANGRFFYLPFVSALLFVVSWSLAIWRRHHPPLHSRYMVGTALAAIDAVTSRLLFFYGPPLAEMTYPLIGFGLTNAVLVALWLADRGPHRRAFLHLLMWFAPLHLFWFTGAQTDWWLDVVRWFRALPLT